MFVVLDWTNVHSPKRYTVFLSVAEFHGVDIPPFVLLSDRFSNNELFSYLLLHIRCWSTYE